MEFRVESLLPVQEDSLGVKGEETEPGNIFPGSVHYLHLSGVGGIDIVPEGLEYLLILGGCLDLPCGFAYQFESVP
ncbi:MAG: hypothetical protein BWY86_00416 [Candidatus Aminicenantes bacterium ADurb.Bin508]|nr:MAG: hypothetical protein BWY86_00416 [Candidatus Aminicenantes bacterium ADurb.Bin508]